MKDSFLISASGIKVEYYSGDSTLAPLACCYDEFEILHVVSGSGRFVIEGTEYAVSPRCVFLMKPFKYRVCELNGESAYEIYSIKFSAESLHSDALSLIKEISEGDDGVSFWNSSAIAAPVLSLFDRLSFVEGLSEREQGIYLSALLSELAVLLSVSASERGVRSDDTLGAEIMKYLNDFIDRDIPLDRLARRFFVSKYHLCRAFKAYSGVSVHSYVRHKRIIYAKQLIESGETAQRAADRVGFGDYSAFYRAYVKIVGSSPSAKFEEADES